MAELPFKVLVIGDSTVGKTSFTDRYTSNKFKGEYKSTQGVDYAVKRLQLNDNQSIRLMFWDIAGQERYRLLTRTYYKGAAGCLVMFDVTNRQTLEGALIWKKDLDEKVMLPSGSNVPAVLLANKIDLTHQRVVDSEEIERFARENGFIDCKEISVKDNRNLGEGLKLLIDRMLALDETRDVLQQAVDRRNEELVVKNRSSQQDHACHC